MQGIEIRHLRYFLRVAEELHFGRAAEILGISQAPLSQQIRHLEERIGVRLFDRTTRSVQLTPAGKVLFERAREALAGVDSAISDAQSAGGLNAGKLVLGTVSLALHTFLPAAMRDFSARNPAVQLDMLMHTTEEQMALLEARKIDLAFMRPPRSLAGIASREVHREGFVAVLPESSPLATKPDLSVADMRDERFIMFSAILGIGYQDVVLQHCQQAGFRPNVVQRVSHTLAVVTMAAAGLGVGILPAWVQNEPLSGVVYRPLEELPKAVSLVVAWRENTTNPFCKPFADASIAAAKAAMGEGAQRPVTS